MSFQLNNFDLHRWGSHDGKRMSYEVKGRLSPPVPAAVQPPSEIWAGLTRLYKTLPNTNPHGWLGWLGWPEMLKGMNTQDLFRKLSCGARFKQNQRAPGRVEVFLYLNLAEKV